MYCKMVSFCEARCIVRWLASVKLKKLSCYSCLLVDTRRYHVSLGSASASAHGAGC